MSVLFISRLYNNLSCFKIYPIFISEKEEMKNDGGIKEENQVPAGN